MRYTLDSQLLNLLQKEQSVGILPLALRRFASGFGQEAATVAMRSAVGQLLDAYFEETTETASPTPISVGRLGTLAGAQVQVPTKLTSPKTAYSLGAPKTHRPHTGAIVFSSGRPRISVPSKVDKATARISVAHEIGHLLIHRRLGHWDSATVRLPSTLEEEALAEYAARLLLMPASRWAASLGNPTNLAEFVLRVASTAGVTVHAAAARLGDPDIPEYGVRGAILWRLNPQTDRAAPVAQRMTPQWHLCPGVFVPVGKCAARVGSLTAELAASEARASASQLEDVRIGSFAGTFLAQGYAWGSLDDGTRLVLTVYLSPHAEEPASAEDIRPSSCVASGLTSTLSLAQS